MTDDMKLSYQVMNVQRSLRINVKGPLPMERLLALVRRKSWLQIPQGVWLIAVLCALALVLYAHRTVPHVFWLHGDAFVSGWHNDENEVLQPAVNWLHGKGYSFDGHPTVRREFGPTLWYGLLMALGGQSFGPILLANAVCMIGATCLGYVLGRDTFNADVGILTAAMVATNTTYFVVAYSPISDATVYPLVLATLIVLFRYLRHPVPRYLWSLAFLFAGMVLMRGALLQELPVIVAVVWFRQRRLAPIAAVLIPLIILSIPWTMRNYATFDRLIPFSNRLGSTLLVTSGPTALNMPFDAPYAPPGISAEEMIVLMQGAPVRTSARYEIYFEDRCKAAVIFAIRSQPYRFTLLVCRRFIALCSPTQWRIQTPWYLWSQVVKFVVIVVPGTLGLWFWRREPWALTAWAWIICHFAFHSILAIDQFRYRIAIEPLWMIAAAALMLRARSPQPASSSRTACTSPVGR